MARWYEPSRESPETGLARRGHVYLYRAKGKSAAFSSPTRAKRPLRHHSSAVWFLTFAAPPPARHRPVIAPSAPPGNPQVIKPGSVSCLMGSVAAATLVRSAGDFQRLALDGSEETPTVSARQSGLAKLSQATTHLYERVIALRPRVHPLECLPDNLWRDQRYPSLSCARLNLLPCS